MGQITALTQHNDESTVFIFLYLLTWLMMPPSRIPTFALYACSFVCLCMQVVTIRILRNGDVSCKVSVGLKYLVSTPCSKKVVHQLISITQSILNGFSKFLHCHTLWKIGDKTIIKDFTTPETCRCTTLWNINFQKLLELKQWLSGHTTLIYSIRVSQGSVATRLRCGVIFNDSFIANFLQSVPVKEL